MRFLLIAALLAIPATARAQSYEEIASEAIRVDRDGLAGVLWSMSAPCSDGDDLAKRQCKMVRDSVLKRFSGQMLIVPGDATAFQVAAYDAEKKSAPVVLQGCIACAEPLKIDGTAYYVTSDKGVKAWKGGVATAGAIHETSRAFKSEAAASKWSSETAPRFQTEFIVSLPKALKTWKDDGKSGISLAVLGFRVYDPCDGGIICASPKSGKASVNKKACGGAVVEGTTDDGEDAPKVEELPETLSAAAIKKAMAPVREAATACFDNFGVPGDAKLHVTVSSEGAVLTVEQSGDFEGTPTGDCIEKAVTGVTFPKTKKKKQSFKYPIVLR